MLPDSILPTPEDDIARILRDYERRLSHLETLEGPGAEDVGARVFNSAVISIPNGAVTALTFDSERWDTSNLHNPAFNPSRITFPIAGRYVIFGNVRWQTNIAGARRVLIIRVNGGLGIASHEQRPPLAAGLPEQIVSTEDVFVVGDYIELVAFQDSGVALNIQPVSRYSPHFMAQLIAAT